MMRMNRFRLYAAASALLVGSSSAFSVLSSSTTPQKPSSTKLHDSSNPLIDLMEKISPPQQPSSSSRFCKARELITSLVEEEQCFSTEAGAREFGDVCALNIVYEDCFEPQPMVGRDAVTNHMLAKVAQRKGKGDVRIDRISDGNNACGFAWTWVTDNEEGLRGTTFVSLNANGEIDYVREIPEPIYKPGDLTVELLKAVTADAERKPKPEFTPKTPTVANEVAKYLFEDVQGGEIDEALRFFSDSIIYRDFNYEEPLNGPAEVRTFLEDFDFPGIEFRPTRFDDGIDSTCFTWEVCLDGAPETIRGISFYELEPDTRKISYIRDVPCSAILPPPLGKLARDLRPGLGVFQGVPLGSRPGGK